jgi:hypothetical protein
MHPQVLIQVRGGIVVSVHATQTVDVLIVDWDNVRMGDTNHVTETVHGSHESLNKEIDQIHREMAT